MTPYLIGFTVAVITLSLVKTKVSTDMSTKILSRFFSFLQSLGHQRTNTQHKCRRCYSKVPEFTNRIFVSVNFLCLSLFLFKSCSFTARRCTNIKKLLIKYEHCPTSFSTRPRCFTIVLCPGHVHTL